MSLTANVPYVHLCSLPFRKTDKSLENKREMSVPKALHAHILLLISLE